ncbi:MAG: response regulator [Deltaproteobacteria bacterium]|nr:response regulator [Deltaproteobacteria bacterium]
MARILIVDDEDLTRRRVVRLLNESGHEVFEATDGFDGLARVHEHNPDLIIVDFIMPKMNGYQFCASLRAIANHKETPVVLMSVRTDRVGASFIDRFDVRDAISKPFEDEALLAVIDNVIRSETPEARAQRTKRGPLKDVFSMDKLLLPNDPLTVEASRITGIIVRKIPDIQSKKEDIIHALIDGMNDIRPSEDLESVPDDNGGEGSPALVGNVSAIPLSDVVQLLSMQRQSGILDVVSYGSAASVQFHRGKIRMAVARGVRSEFLLGRYLVEEQMLSRQDLDLLLSSRTGPHLLGEQLVKLGYITDEELTKVLGRQTTDIVVELLRWSFGKFFFHPGREIPGSSQAGNSLDATTVVLEGLRQVDEWRLIEQEIPSFDSVPYVVSGSLFDVSDLSQEEALVLGFVDGERKIRDVISAADMGSFSVCNILYRLVSVKLIECRSS